MNNKRRWEALAASALTHEKLVLAVVDLQTENRHLKLKRRNQRIAYRSLQRAYTELLRVHGDLRRSKPLVVYKGGAVGDARTGEHMSPTAPPILEFNTTTDKPYEES